MGCEAYASHTMFSDLHARCVAREKQVTINTEYNNVMNPEATGVDPDLGTDSYIPSEATELSAELRLNDLQKEVFSTQYQRASAGNMGFEHVRRINENPALKDAFYDSFRSAIMAKPEEMENFFYIHSSGERAGAYKLSDIVEIDDSGRLVYKNMAEVEGQKPEVPEGFFEALTAPYITESTRARPFHNALSSLLTSHIQSMPANGVSVDSYERYIPSSEPEPDEVNENEWQRADILRIASWLRSDTANDKLESLLSNPNNANDFGELLIEIFKSEGVLNYNVNVNGQTVRLDRMMEVDDNENLVFKTVDTQGRRALVTPDYLSGVLQYEQAPRTLRALSNLIRAYVN